MTGAAARGSPALAPLPGPSLGPLLGLEKVRGAVCWERVRVMDWESWERVLGEKEEEEVVLLFRL